jgi:hypothetical protein
MRHLLRAFAISIALPATADLLVPLFYVWLLVLLFKILVHVYKIKIISFALFFLSDKRDYNKIYDSFLFFQ